MLTGLTPAVAALNAMFERAGITRERHGEALALAMRDALLTTAEGERLAAAQQALATLGLEVRDPEGMPLHVRSVTVGDQRTFVDPDMADQLASFLAEDGVTPYQLVLVMAEEAP